jgi:hypothetical protein
MTAFQSLMADGFPRRRPTPQGTVASRAGGARDEKLIALCTAGKTTSWTIRRFKWSGS